MRDIGCWIVEDKDGLLGASHIQIHTHTHTHTNTHIHTNFYLHACPYHPCMSDANNFLKTFFFSFLLQIVEMPILKSTLFANDQYNSIIEQD